MAEATLVATLKAEPSLDGAELRKLPSATQWLEVRADLLGWIDPAWLRNQFPGRLLFSLRSCREGGNFDGSDAERRALLLRASRGYDLVDLEAARDNQPDLLSEIPPHRRVISSHGVVSGDIDSTFSRLSSIEAHLYKLVTRPSSAGDCLAPLRLLKSLARSDVVAYPSGQLGLWGRLIAPQLGAPIVFGLANESNGDEPTIERLMADYGLPELRSVEQLYGIVGNPVSHSLSPRLHNAAYRATARPALFMPFQVESFPDFWSGVAMSRGLESLGLSVRGLTVASPYKEASLEAAGARSSMVSRAGSANIFVRDNGHWRADTTDPEGVVLAIRRRGIALKAKRAAVVGCGGAGRAVAAALHQQGAVVTLVNRGAERGHRAVELLGLPFTPLAGFKTAGFAIVVNATPVGREGSEMPFDIDALGNDAIVVDLAYGRNPTPLIEKACKRGMITIDGREVLLIQAARQFRMMTGGEMPDGLARRVLGMNEVVTSSGGTGRGGGRGR